MTRIHVRMRGAGAVLVGWAMLSLGAAAGPKPDLEFSLGGGADRPDSIAFSSNLEWMVAVRPSGKVTVHELAQGREVAHWEAGAGAERELPLQRTTAQRRAVFLPGDTQVLVAQGTNLVVFEVLTGAVVKSLEPTTAAASSLAVSADGSVAAALVHSLPPAMAFWSVASGSQLTGLRTKAVFPVQLPRRNLNRAGLPSEVDTIPVSNAMALNGDGSLFAVGKGHDEVDVWNLKTGEWSSFVVGPGEQPPVSSLQANDLAFLPEGRLAAVFSHLDLAVYALPAGPRGDILLQRKTKPASPLEMHALAVSKDGQRIVACGLTVKARPAVGDVGVVHDLPAGAELRVWDIAKARVLFASSGEPKEVFGAVGIDATGRRVAAVAGTGFGRVLTGALQKQFRPPMQPWNTAGTGPAPLRVAVWNLEPR